MRIYTIILLLAISALALSSFSPQVTSKRQSKFKTYFACSQTGQVFLSAEQFLMLLNDRMCAKDSANNTFRVQSFEMSYSETGLYQDAEGLPIVHTDYSYGSFRGDMFDENWKKQFKEHAYKGDTIKIQSVRVKGLDSLTYLSSNIEVILK